jgi:DNA-dependent RNA polymerase auxiliary subunit epsilon
MIYKLLSQRQTDKETDFPAVEELQADHVDSETENKLCEEIFERLKSERFNKWHYS